MLLGANHSEFKVARYVHGCPKNLAQFLYDLTISNINWFSKLFHCLNQKKICNNTIIKDRTTPEVCCYTTLWNATEWGKLLRCFTDHVRSERHQIFNAV